MNPTAYEQIKADWRSDLRADRLPSANWHLVYQNTGVADASRCEDGAGLSRSPLAETQRNHCGQAAASVPHSAQADALSSLRVARSEVSAMGACNPGGSAKASAGAFLGVIDLEDEICDVVEGLLGRELTWRYRWLAMQRYMRPFRQKGSIRASAGAFSGRGRE